MPSYYAHYRFGSHAIPLLPAEIRRPIQRFRQLYDVGLHGPDLFFYHNIFSQNRVVTLGSKFHQQTGTEFFTRICKHLRLEPNEAAVAYLYGVLAHFALDSVCHPFVHEASADGKVGHVEMETEFDRFLLVLDGKRPPNNFDCSPHMKLTRGECVTVSAFYPSVSPGDVRSSIQNMAASVRMLCSPKKPVRAVLNTASKVCGGKFDAHIMSRTPNRNCQHLNEPMYERYQQALAQYPQMVERLMAHLSHNAPLGEAFEKTFG